MEKKSQKLYLTDYNSLTLEDLWQAHYQNLLIILLNEFIELNVNINMITWGIKCKACDCFLEYTNLKDNLIKSKCLCCKNNYQKTFDENIKKKTFNTYKFSNHDTNNFILLLQKDIYPYEC